ncbi:uncharacterized protein LOC124491180 [Dermatophagoides farinae]|uniref:Uncharacterized protein n=1 Tax=Dermatophagoides farinae TaxID=6954 RepID=A0A922L5N0_DERFA|nr:hypothetical protein DERF_008609 [Dermatophagoides farinae]
MAIQFNNYRLMGITIIVVLILINSFLVKQSQSAPVPSVEDSITTPKLLHSEDESSLVTKSTNIKSNDENVVTTTNEPSSDYDDDDDDTDDDDDDDNSKQKDTESDDDDSDDDGENYDDDDDDETESDSE